MSRKAEILTVALVAVCTAAVLRAGTVETVSTYGPDLLAYATVERPDGTYRRMLVSPQALTGTPDGAVPDGTRILMETYYRPGEVGTVFHKLKQNGRWEYGSFPASNPNLATRPQASCLSCHVGAADTDLTYTKPSLDRVASGGALEVFHCDRSGRQPCRARVYNRGGP